jgi:hypothetical protein
MPEQPPLTEPKQITEEDDPNIERIDTGVQAEKPDMKLLLDYDYLWYSFEAQIRGGKLVRNKRGYWEIRVNKLNADPFMNDQGIKDTMALIRANINVITGTGVLDQDRVLSWCERFQKTLALFFYQKQKDYELEDAKVRPLVSTIMVAYETNLRKSIGGTALINLIQSSRQIYQENTSDANIKPTLNQRV